MKVLVTGGTGLIGQYCIAQLEAKGYEVHAVSSVPRPVSATVHWHQSSLLDLKQTRDLVRDIRPSHLLHLAWYTKHGKYWTAPENLNWVQGSLALIQAFTDAGGERLAVAGTCAEYDWHGGICYEDRTPLRPVTLYGNCKHALQVMLSAWCERMQVPGVWGRVFSLYGPGEHPDRLVASVIRALLKGESATCGNPELVRDYSHAEDVAAAFVALLESDLVGPVNIGSGEGVTLRHLVEKIGHKLDGHGLVGFRAATATSAGEPHILLPDIARLASTGWTKTFDLDKGLEDTIDWWRKYDRLPNS